MAKQIFKGGTLTLPDTGGPFIIYLTSMKWDDKMAKVDATDTGTTAGSKEYIFSGREEMSASFEMWTQNTLQTGTLPYTTYVKTGKAYTSAILNFEAITITKNLVFESVEVNATLDNMVKITATATLT
jgi:hypothetical protein